MKHARPDYNRIQDPANIIPENEPVFLLRAKDVTAPAVVLYWSEKAEQAGATKEMVEMGRQQAKEMKHYQEKNGSQVPDLPNHNLKSAGSICLSPFEDALKKRIDFDSAIKNKRLSEFKKSSETVLGEIVKLNKPELVKYFQQNLVDVYMWIISNEL